MINPALDPKSKPEQIDEVDRLTALLARERLQNAQLVMERLDGGLREKYKIGESDGIDLTTGHILRGPVVHQTAEVERTASVNGNSPPVHVS